MRRRTCSDIDDVVEGWGRFVEIGGVWALWEGGCSLLFALSCLREAAALVIFRCERRGECCGWYGVDGDRMEGQKDVLGENVCNNGSRRRQLVLQGNIPCNELERLTSEALPDRKSRE
jgi:hypothetical protein